MLRRAILSTAVALLALAGAGPARAAEGRPEVGGVGKGYKGPEGLVLRVVRVGPESAGEVLLQFAGIDHQWNRRIFRARVVPAGTGQDYQVTVDGKPWVAVTLRRGGGGQSLVEAYLPGGPTDARCAYDEAISRDIVPEHLLTAWLQQEGKEP